MMARIAQRRAAKRTAEQTNSLYSWRAAQQTSSLYSWRAGVVR